jgi:hypothetical protein
MALEEFTVMTFRYTVPLCAVRQDKIKQKPSDGIDGNARA